MSLRQNKLHAVNSRKSSQGNIKPVGAGGSGGGGGGGGGAGATKPGGTRFGNDETQANDTATDEPSPVDLVRINASALLNSEYGVSYMRCSKCNCYMERYAEDALASLVVICSTIIHRDCNLAAPFILDMITAIIKSVILFCEFSSNLNSLNHVYQIYIYRITSKNLYSWQTSSNFYVAGNYKSVSKQFLRCVLHQLSSNEIFYQLFQCKFEESSSLEVIAAALNDFVDLNSVTALKLVFKVLVAN